MTQGIRMPILRIHVENFKSFSFVDVELSRFNVVIGSNAAGKSNFTSIFRFLHDIASHGLVNAIAMQGGAEYLRNAKIGTERDLAIRVVYQPDMAMEVVDTGQRDLPLLGLRACESSYEFAIRFGGEGDDFVITRDRLVIGCMVSACECTGRETVEKEALGHAEIRVSCESGEVHYEVDLPGGCCLTRDEIIPVLFRNKRLPKRTLLLETIYGSPIPHLDRFFDRIAIYDIDPKLPKKGVVITGKRGARGRRGKPGPCRQDHPRGPGKEEEIFQPPPGYPAVRRGGFRPEVHGRLAHPYPPRTLYQEPRPARLLVVGRDDHHLCADRRPLF